MVVQIGSVGGDRAALVGRAVRRGRRLPHKGPLKREHALSRSTRRSFCVEMLNIRIQDHRPYVIIVKRSKVLYLS